MLARMEVPEFVGPCLHLLASLQWCNTLYTKGLLPNFDEGGSPRVCTVWLLTFAAME